jgi:hypothetical protein
MCANKHAEFGTEVSFCGPWVSIQVIGADTLRVFEIRQWALALAVPFPSRNHSVEFRT